MTWIAILFMGMALGWALELLFDLWFWGRRNRNLTVDLATCRSNFKAAESKLSESRELVTQCQYDLTDLSSRHAKLETQAEEISVALQSSQQRIGQLDAQSAELRDERDQLNVTLEEVDQWVETRMRQRIWDTASWKRGFIRSKERSMAYVRSMAATTTSKMGQAVGQVSGRVATVKGQVGRAFRQPWFARLLNSIYCAGWRLIGVVYKGARMPQSCSYNSK